MAVTDYMVLNGVDISSAVTSMKLDASKKMEVDEGKLVCNTNLLDALVTLTYNQTFLYRRRTRTDVDDSLGTTSTATDHGLWRGYVDRFERGKTTTTIYLKSKLVKLANTVLNVEYTNTTAKTMLDAISTTIYGYACYYGYVNSADMTKLNATITKYSIVNKDALSTMKDICALAEVTFHYFTLADRIWISSATFNGPDMNFYAGDGGLYDPVILGPPKWSKDITTIINKVTVSGNGVTATAQDATSQATYGLREQTIQRQDIWSATEAQQIADAIIALQKDPKITCKFKMKAGWVHHGYNRMDVDGGWYGNHPGFYVDWVINDMFTGEVSLFHGIKTFTYYYPQTYDEVELGSITADTVGLLKETSNRVASLEAQVGQDLNMTDGPTFDALTLTNDLSLGGRVVFTGATAKLLADATTTRVEVRNSADNAYAGLRALNLYLDGTKPTTLTAEGTTGRLVITNSTGVVQLGATDANYSHLLAPGAMGLALNNNLILYGTNRDLGNSSYNIRTIYLGTSMVVGAQPFLDSARNITCGNITSSGAITTGQGSTFDLWQFSGVRDLAYNGKRALVMREDWAPTTLVINYGGDFGQVNIASPLVVSGNLTVRSAVSTSDMGLLEHSGATASDNVSIGLKRTNQTGTLLYLDLWDATNSKRGGVNVGAVRINNGTVAIDANNDHVARKITAGLTGGYIGLGHGIRTANRAELHLNSVGDNPSEINFGVDTYDALNIKWQISSRTSAEGDNLEIYVGPKLNGWIKKYTFTKGGAFTLNDTSAGMLEVPYIRFNKGAEVRICNTGGTINFVSNWAGDAWQSIKCGAINSVGGRFDLSGGAPLFYWHETDATLPAGRWRMGVDGDTLLIDHNTASDGLYGTKQRAYFNSYGFYCYGVVSGAGNECFSAYMNATAQSIPINAETIVKFNSTKYNNGTCYSTSTGVFITPYAGRYLITAQVIFPSMNVNKYGRIRLTNNSTTTYADSGDVYNACTFVAPSICKISVILDLASGASVTVSAFTNSDTSEPTYGNASVLGTYFQAEYLGA